MLLGAGLVSRSRKVKYCVREFDYAAEKFSVLIAFMFLSHPRQDTWRRMAFPPRNARIELLHRMREECYNVSLPRNSQIAASSF
jgi:hypothetical protein